MDTAVHARKWSAGIGVFSGPHYLLNQPKSSEFNSGFHLGAGGQVGYQTSEHVSISGEIRYMQSKQVVNFKTQHDPDLFISNTSTIQVPVLVSYSILNSKKEHILGFNFGLAYQWNKHKITYEEIVYRTTSNISTVPIRQVSVSSSDEDISLICGIYRHFNLNKTKTAYLSLFNEYQMNMGSSRFRNRINNPVYLVFTDQDQFTPLFVRLGVNINVGL